jgi:N-methylhydantoinase B
LHSATQTIDPVTFEIVSHRLHEVTKEMGTTLERVGGTVNTTQLRDYMAAVYLPNGDILSAGDSMGWHVACAGFAVKHIIKEFQDNIHEDDVFLLNDPYVAAIHQSDVYIISPIHYEKLLVGWSATFVHVMDIGAMSPGGNSPGATEIVHEGLRIPGVKLVDGGRLRQDIFNLIINMTRQPTMVGLDLKCEIAANNVAKSRMQALFTRYGRELIETVGQGLIAQSEAVLRRRIREIPDGSWNETASIQTGGGTWTVRLRLDKKDDHLDYVFTGTDPQADVGINLPIHATFGSCFDSVLSLLGFDIPKNHGMFAPINLVAPPASVVNVAHPAPVSLNTTSGGAMVRFVTFSTLSQAVASSNRWKAEAMAQTMGGRFFRHAGVSQSGGYYVSTLLEMAGNGATSARDGVDSGSGVITCHNIEWVERNFPLLYLFRRHAQDSAGAGKYRGGAGVEVAMAVHHAPEGRIKCVALGMAGLKNSGSGLFGGYPGAPSLLIHCEDTGLETKRSQGRTPTTLGEVGGRQTILPYIELPVEENDVLYMRASSGGGYGDPLERNPDDVREDIGSGLVSPEASHDIYGVVLDRAVGVSVKATEQRRREIRADRQVDLTSSNNGTSSHSGRPTKKSKETHR